jgi:phospholipid/cholesterol/gamma-HCH transport system substrate-binding protein
LRGTAPLARVVALAAIAVAVVFAAVLLLGGGNSYTVTAQFENASQLVKGNLVQVSGMPVGKVTDIHLTPDGQAAIKMQINGDYAPLRRGTLATVRQTSVSGVANRYIDLRLPSSRAPAIPDGGTIGQDSTTTAVDLDEIFNTLDPKTRKDLQAVIKGSANQHRLRGNEMNAGLLYLNPSLQASSRLFNELNSDSRLLERFVVSSSQLVTDLADRRDDLAGLVDHLATTTTAIGDQQQALADSVQQLPPFMRRANTTFLNLRAALDDLKPLVDDSKPVAKKLRPFLRQLRPLAQDAQPTVRQLVTLIRQAGPNNDLIDLTNGNVPVRNQAIGPVQANGSSREGAFPASARALKASTPELASARPYAPDLVGWFDDFSHSGVYDALGGESRAALYVNLFTLTNNVPNILGGVIPPSDRAANFAANAKLRQNNRCPGSMERDSGDGSIDLKAFSAQTGCDPTQTPLGP